LEKKECKNSSEYKQKFHWNGQKQSNCDQNKCESLRIRHHLYRHQEVISKTSIKSNQIIVRPKVDHLWSTFGRTMANFVRCTWE